jgi:1,4-alpha-glucan branching enzyme
VSKGPWPVLAAAVAIGTAGCGAHSSHPASGLDAGPVQQDAGKADSMLAPPSDATIDAPAEGAGPSMGPIALPPSGMAVGATVVDDAGTLFRVWAPSASAVSVAGDFDAGASFPMTAEANGYFSTTVSSAQAGQHYRYTIVDDGGTFTRFDPRARALAGGADGEATIIDPRSYAWKTPPFTPPVADAAVIYEMYVPAFNVPSGQQHGTFQSAILQLSALAALGINMIELMPSAQFGGDWGWGYNPVGYCAPQATYGAPDDLRQFVDAAHALGIGVMLDAVYNHYDSAQHGLWCFDGNCPNDNGVYFFSDPTYASTPWGPRPDYSNPQVADFLVDSLFTWLSDYRFDGFRWDSTSNIRAIDGSGTVPGGQAFLSRANDTLHGLFPGTLMVAEDYKGDATITAPTAGGGLGFDSQWDGFNSAVDGAATQPTDATRDVNAIANVIRFAYNGVATQRVIFTDNHDLAGNGSAPLPARIDSANPTSLHARKLSMLATGVMLASPGIPMLLQGQEILQTGAWDVSNTPAMNWSDAVTYAPILAFHTDMVRLRRNLDGWSAGLLGGNVNVFHVNAAADVLAWQRWNSPGDDVVAVANFSGASFAQYNIGLPAAGVWHVRLSSDDTRYSPDFGNVAEPDVTASTTGMDGLPASGTIALAPYHLLILSR